MVAVEQHLRGHLARPDDFAQRIEEAAFVVARRTVPRARGQPRAGDVEHLARDVAQLAAAGIGASSAELRHRVAQRLPLVQRPVLDQIPRRIERALVVEQPDPQRGQRADAVPRPAVRAAHFEERLQPHFGKGGRQMVVPVVHRRLLAGQDRQFALQEIAEAEARRVDIAAVAVDEVHRHIERIVGVAFVAEAVLEHERQHAGARAGRCPTRCGCDSSASRWACPSVNGELANSAVASGCSASPTRNFFAMSASDSIVEVHLDRAGAQHHVEAHACRPAACGSA